MSNNSNYPWDTPENDPWNQGTYRTGSTRPPKSHGGIIAVLLVLLILLSGIVTILGVVNIRLFRQVNKETNKETLPISFSNEEKSAQIADSEIPAEIAITVTETPDSDAVSMEPAATGEENGPQAGGLSLQDIYSKVIDSVVSISCTYPGGNSTGSGVKW